MKIKVIQIFATLLILSSVNTGCKRFNSNKVNHNLIQGVWQQVEITHPNETNDSLITEKVKDQITLTFSLDSCEENIANVDHKLSYSFTIDDYILGLSQKEKETTYLEISKLTANSLILRGRSISWKYIKKAD